MDGKGFFHSTAALITALATLLAALVALGAFLFGEGIFRPLTDGGGNGGGGTQVGGKVQVDRTLGRAGTGGIELDSEAGIARKTETDGDIVFYDILDKFRVYNPGQVVAWESEKPPTQQQCTELLNSHGADLEFALETGTKYCVRSSGGRIAYLAIVNDAKEYYVALWPKA